MGSGPTVCPFVALVEDRDRRADGPDTRNRCYAAPAPRQRELAYQAEYCYAERFSTCAAFLDWAARNAAEPSYPVPGVQAARLAESAASVPGGRPHPGLPPAQGDGAVDARGDADTAPERQDTSPTDWSDWVSASAWAAFPSAPVEDDAALESASADDRDADADEGVEDAETGREEATTAPRVPAAMPVRRRKRPLQPIRSRGSGEWYYSDPPDREPLVRRRFSAMPPVALGAIGLLVAALVVLLIPSLLAGGAPDDARIAGGSASPAASARAAATARPTARSTASAGPATPEPEPRRRSYRVKNGDSLSGIAARFGVSLELLQCQNLIRDPDLISVGQELTIPPEGYACAPGWRRATPTPEPQVDEEAGTDPPEA
jgi:LysM repeat protein